MEQWQLWVAGATLAIIGGLFRYTHVRITQVRQEAIDIADRNTRHVEAMSVEAQKDAGQGMAFLREDFVNRAIDLKGNFEQLRRESREDLKGMGESNEKFRAEMRGRLDEILREIRNGHGH